METVAHEFPSWVPTFLRRIGGVALVTSGIVFLVQETGSMNHLQSTIGFSLLVLLVFLVGLLSRRVFGDVVGGVVGVGSAILLLPMVAAHVGRVIYTDALGLGFLDIAALLGSIGVMGIVASLGCRIIAPRSSSRFQGVLLASLPVLVVPIREWWVMIPLVGGVAIAQRMALDAIAKSRSGGTRTAGEILAEAGVVATPLVLLGRQFLFHHGADVSEVLSALGVGMISFVVVLLVRHLSEHRAVQLFAELLGGVLLLFSTLALGHALALSSELSLLVSGAALIALSVTLVEGRMLVRLGGTGALSMALLMSIVAGMDGVVGGVVFLLGGIAVLVAERLRDQALMVLGVVALGTGLLAVVAEVLMHVTFGSWVSIGIGGAVVLLAASAIERHAHAMKGFVAERYRIFRSW